MMNNLINVVAKIYTGMVVAVTLITLVIGKGSADGEIIGLAAVIGMLIGFGTIMIGNLIMEARWFIKKHSVKKEQTNKVEVKEAAQ